MKLTFFVSQASANFCDGPLGTVRKFPHLPKYGHARLGEGGFDLARF